MIKRIIILGILLLLSWNIVNAIGIQGVFIARDNDGLVYGTIELRPDSTFFMNFIENVEFSGEYVIAIKTKRGEADLSQPTSILFYTGDKKLQGSGTIMYRKESNKIVIRYKGQDFYSEIVNN